MSAVPLQVGLSKDYYDIASWPQELQQQIVTPAVAAAAKGKGLKVPTATQHSSAQALGQPQRGVRHQPSQLQQQQQQLQQVVDSVQPPKDGADTSIAGGTLDQFMRVSAVPNSGPELEVLRQRLWAMLQTEAEACSV